MSKIIVYSLLPIILFSHQASASSCNVEGYTVGFFNGVANTEQQAKNALKKIKSTLNIKQHQGEKVDYQLFYNDSYIGSSGINVLGDLAETFDQRLVEIEQIQFERWELFWELFNGRGDGTIAQRIGALITTPISFLIDLFTQQSHLIITTFLERLNRFVDSPETETTQRNQRLINDAHTWQGKKLIYLAHSQGNLWVNRSFEYVTGQKGYDESNIKVIHIAPASPKTNGDYILSGNDLVINGLQLTGIGSVPTYNFTAKWTKADRSGHKLIEIYLTDPTALNMLKSSVTRAFSSVQTPNMDEHLFEITYDYSKHFVSTHDVPTIDLVDNNDDWADRADIYHSDSYLEDTGGGQYQLRPAKGIDTLSFTHHKKPRDFHTVTIDQCEKIPNDKPFVLGEYSKETMPLSSLWPNLPDDISTDISIRDRYGWELNKARASYNEYRESGHLYIGSFAGFKAIEPYTDEEKAYLDRNKLQGKYELEADFILFATQS
ncbi:hypothetical protein OH458_21375 [Vibrio sp. MarTm2]|uniref:hypothetical protein n=1 Tax=Vibrio sp. MarTm2 TaxID=2998831 RepID=UPI0022CD9621|nr:hypothetical protein [Vibrio sp. MarTm2]MDA0130618.1 hypothetical protein [Vibrio sp. MarTm2]